GATYIGARLAKVEKGGLPATAYTPPTPTIQHAMQVYNTAGTYTFVAPVTGWYWVKVYGGGGAAAAYTGNSQGEGGGGGGYSGKWVYHVAGDVTTVTVGAAGVYGGANGGTSSYGASHSATGGVTATAGGANGAGGTGIGGKINLTGQSGVDGNASGLWAGIGGDAAGPDGGKGAMSANGATWPGGGGGLLSYSSNIIWVGAPAAGGVIINY
ncbi:hypothetical protein H4S14_004368, partial [Agrobacterium vitis]|nr:hypothetical protein [Agrobacterium vitis]MBE1440582.1 hypothetical protein [Agrobacterium vitis]